MQIDKAQIIEFLKNRGDQDKAAQAQSNLPDQVDTDQHANLSANWAWTQRTCSAGAGGGLAGKMVSEATAPVGSSRDGPMATGTSHNGRLTRHVDVRLEPPNGEHG